MPQAEPPGQLEQRMQVGAAGVKIQGERPVDL